jgi:hypothetical protein
MYLKTFFIQKYPLLIMAMYPLFAAQPQRTRATRLWAGEDASNNGLLLTLIGHSFPASIAKEVGEGWPYIFCFPQLLLLYHGRVSIPFFITDSIAQWLRR